MVDKISTLSIVFMAVSTGLSILVPIAAIVVMGIKKRMNWKAMILGTTLFLVFVMILESILHNVVLGTDPSKSVIYQSPWLYMLYVGFAAGIFEETARLLCFKFILKTGDNESIDTGISYGLGHGGIESIFIGGLATVSNLIMSSMYNSGILSSVTARLNGEQLSGFNQGMDILRNTPPDYFLLSGIERMAALVLQISLSLFVLKAVTDKKWKYFIYAILIHAGIDMFAALYQRGVIADIYIMEGILLAGASATAYFAFRHLGWNKVQMSD